MIATVIALNSSRTREMHMDFAFQINAVEICQVCIRSMRRLLYVVLWYAFIVFFPCFSSFEHYRVRMSVSRAQLHNEPIK